MAHSTEETLIRGLFTKAWAGLRELVRWCCVLGLTTAEGHFHPWSKEVKGPTPRPRDLRVRLTGAVVFGRRELSSLSKLSKEGSEEIIIPQSLSLSLFFLSAGDFHWVK